MRHTTFRFALDPTTRQRQALVRHAGASRYAYNQCLRLLADSLTAKESDPSVDVPWSGFDLINKFNQWKRSEAAGRIFSVAVDGTIRKQITGLAWRHEVSAQVFEEAAVDLGHALAARQIGRCSIRMGDDHPRSVVLPTIGSIRVCDDTRRLRRLLRPVNQFDSRTGKELVAPRAKILFATIARRGDRWYISLTVHAPDLHPQRRHQPHGGRSHGGFVGVDRGLTQFAVTATADGTEVGRWTAPRPLARQLKRVRGRSRSLSRKQRGSSNRAKAARRLSREHARIANLRSCFLHEVSGQLAKTHSKLAIEDLQVANLLANRRLSRAVGDAGWAEFARQLTYKAHWFNCELVVCDRWFPSTKTCHACGTIKPQMSLGERTFHCETCGLSCDRDRNAAANLAAWAEHAQAPRTAKRTAGSPRPLEGKALAIASAMVEPTPAKGEPTLGLIA